MVAKDSRAGDVETSGLERSGGGHGRMQGHLATHGAGSFRNGEGLIPGRDPGKAMQRRLSPRCGGGSADSKLESGGGFTRGVANHDDSLIMVDGLQAATGEAARGVLQKEAGMETRQGRADERAKQTG